MNSSYSSRVILTVTFNLALDVTYHVSGFRPGSATRVEDVARRAGGKGVNVARVLHQLGHQVVVSGMAGGFHGRAARADLEALGVRDELVEIEAESRLTVVVVDRQGSATGFWEPGPVVSAEEWKAARAHISELMESVSVLVLAGSLPHGVPADGYAQLIAAAGQAGVPALLDAEGEALKLGVAAHPAVVKINASELSGATGEHDLTTGARALQDAGARVVVVTAGPAGLTCFTDQEVLRAAPPRELTGNPTGAGDAASAALAVGLRDAVAWDVTLADAAALSAATVCAPLAGSFDPAAYRRLRATIRSAPLR